jgi:hypothetical protein
VHSILYIGIPGAVEGIRALEEILDEQGLTFDLDGESHRDSGEAMADATSGKAGQA